VPLRQPPSATCRASWRREAVEQAGSLQEIGEAGRHGGLDVLALAHQHAGETGRVEARVFLLLGQRAEHYRRHHADEALRRAVAEAGELADSAGQALEGATAEEVAERVVALLGDLGLLGAAEDAAEVAEDVGVLLREHLAELATAAGLARHARDAGENGRQDGRNRRADERALDAERRRDAIDEHRRQILHGHGDDIHRAILTKSTTSARPARLAPERPSHRAAECSDYH
jgi:hypothetical protein